VRAYLLPKGRGARPQTRPHARTWSSREASVVTVLLASLGITAGRLNMAVRQRADPYASPCWGNSEGLNDSERSRLFQRGTVRFEVTEAFAGFPSAARAPDTYLKLGDSAEGCRAEAARRSSASNSEAIRLSGSRAEGFEPRVAEDSATNPRQGMSHLPQVFLHPTT
jgi:hypothetical protein